jgi:putative DNA primase/helicase
VWAFLVLIRAWIAAGRPLGAKTLGSFLSWAQTIGGVLRVSGVSGFLQNADAFCEQADRQGTTWRRFFDAWWDTFGDREVGTSDLWAIVAPEQGDPIDLGLGDLDKSRSARTKLGRLLGTMRDRQFGQFRLEAGVTRQRAQLWRLVNVAEPS